MRENPTHTQRNRIVGQQLDQLRAGVAEINDYAPVDAASIVELSDGSKLYPKDQVDRYVRSVKSQVFRILELVDGMILEAKESVMIRNPELEKLAAEILATRTDMRDPAAAFALAQSFLTHRDRIRRDQ